MRIAVLTLLCGLSTSLGVAGGVTAQALQESTSENQGSLNLGEIQSRELDSRASHVWMLDLEMDQYVEVEVRQIGIVAAVLVSDPQGQVVAELEMPADIGAEKAKWIATLAGTWNLLISASATSK